MAIKYAVLVLNICILFNTISCKTKTLFRPLDQKYDAFDWRLFQIISKSSNKNIIASPFSVKLLLTITREAASNKTQNEIQNVLTDPPKELNGLNWFRDVVNTLEQLQDIAAVLTNAIYFKGMWEYKFKKSSTKKKPFHKSNGEIVQASMMYQKGQAFFLDTSELGNGAILLRLPYKGGKFVITFILPNKVNGLDEVIASIKPGLIGELQKELRYSTVDIFIPKFKFKSQLNLKKTLMALNISDVFNKNADLPGFGPSQKGLEDIVQKAGIKVDEEGTEVAVVTGSRLRGPHRGPPPRPLIFNADHPFAFFIEEEATGALLFAGKVTDPTK